MKTLKLVIIIDSLVKGGRERRLLELLKGLNEDSTTEVLVILLRDLVQYPEIYELSNITLKIFPRLIKKDPIIFIKLFRLFRRYRPDIIHSWGTMPSIYVLPLAKILKIKFINAMISNASCDKWSSNWWRARLTFPFTNVVVANSYAGIKAYNVPPKKAYVIHNGFDFNRISNLRNPEEIRKEYGIHTRYVVGMVGAFFDRKDYDTYIETAIRIIRERKDISFLAIGDGPKLNHYKKIIPQDCRNYFLFLGEQNDVESIINIFDVGILATFTEGISNAILEYMALGKPVIATEGGGTNEIVIHRKTGFIIEHGSHTQLANKIQFLIDNPKIGKSFGNNGVERIKNHFSVEQMINATKSLYYQLYFE